MAMVKEALAMSDINEQATNPLWIKCNPLADATIPKYQTTGAAGCDLHATEDAIVRAGDRRVINTGLRLQIPPGYQAQVCSRSGLAAKYGVMVLNAPGIIDQDFTGEIKVILFNSGKEDFIVKKGDRIAQLVFLQVFQAIFQKSEEMPATMRGDGGFGSTGR